MAIVVPNSASVLNASAHIPCSANLWTWLGLGTSRHGDGGRVTWFAGASPILVLDFEPGQAQMLGPFCPAADLSCALEGGGVALVWQKSREK